MADGVPSRSTGCPGEDAVAAFLAGRASDDDAATLENHLDDCGECRSLLAAMLRADDEQATVAGHRGAGRRPQLPADAGSSAIGKKIGRYVIEDVLGVGGMGVVYGAHDPALDRRVALKLLRPALSRSQHTGEVESRLLREAQAMARLTHPNVIAVHDVGQHRGQVFVAMELVDGRTLRTWLGEEPRPWRAVLEVYRRAAHGLSAAHAGGLVHRDFKPDNVLVGWDDRIRVTDFGLARASGATDETAAAAAAVPRAIAARPSERNASPPLATITHTDALVGTPAYMAPELHRGESATTRSDQFSFCVALYEALYGERPFAGQTGKELAVAAAAGAVREAPRGSRIPRALRRVVLRGLAADPEARWPSIGALLVALTELQQARRRRLTVAAAVGLVGGVATLLLVREPERAAAGPTCATSPERLAGAWDAERGAALAAAFAGAEASGTHGATETARRTAAALDDYGQRWLAARVDACAATHVRGEQSEELLDLRMQCLDRKRTALAALVDVLVAAPAATAGRAIGAASQLSPLEECADVTSLTARIPPPADPGLHDRIAAAQVELGRVEALRDAGRYQESVAAGRALHGVVVAIGYRPLEAEVAYALGQALERSADYAGAQLMLGEAVRAAEAGRHDEIAALAWIYQIYAVGYRMLRFADGHRAADHAAAIIERLGHPTGLEARRMGMLAILEMAEGQNEEARQHLEQTIALGERGNLPAVARVSAIDALGMALANLGRVPEARIEHERALALNLALLGPDNPAIAYHHDNIGALDMVTGDDAGAHAHFERSLAIRQAALPPDHPDLGLSYNNLGIIRLGQGDAAGALTDLREAERIFRRTSADGSDIARAVNNQGDALRQLGRLDEAIATNRRAVELFEAALGKDNLDVAVPLTSLAEDQLAAGHYAAAIPLLERAVALCRAGMGANYSDYAYHARALGDAYLGLGKPKQALAYYEDALARLRNDAGASTSPDQVPILEYLTAEPLWQLGLRERAVAAMTAARIWWEAHEGAEYAANAADAADWLKTHRGKAEK